MRSLSSSAGELPSVYTYPSGAKLGSQSSNRSIPVAAAKTPKKPAITSGATVDKISSLCLLVAASGHSSATSRNSI
ncbi:MAG: hypothetical protein QNJ54_35355 [Prochloraceae cyanobacterium]|nr:hypothetical protein [Prochloraceae cyanobacterium]